MTGAVEQRFDAIEIERAELIPFGHDDERVGLVAAGIGVVEKRQAFQNKAGLIHAFGIEGVDARPAVLQRGDDRDRGRIAHVVGVRLEGEAEHGDGLAAHRPAAGREDLAGHRALALVIDRGDRSRRCGPARHDPARS